MAKKWKHIDLFYKEVWSDVDERDKLPERKARIIYFFINFF